MAIPPARGQIVDPLPHDPSSEDRLPALLSKDLSHRFFDDGARCDPQNDDRGLTS
jgi:hypothetical protein